MSKRRKRRRKRQHDSLTSSLVSVTSGSDSEEFPVRQMRRRRKRPIRRRRRRRRRVVQDKSKLGKVNNPNRSIPEEFKQGIEFKSHSDICRVFQFLDIVYPDDHQDNELNDQLMDSDPRCDNPECLCNVKEEVEDNLDSPM